jgi:hypothetical protein
MNELNYASLEASQRLHAKGIVLETEVYWARKYPLGPYELCSLGVDVMYDEAYPAAQFAEVWRELPEMIGGTGQKFYLTIQRLGGFTEAGYESAHHDGVVKSYENANPTDALIDLLIWVEQRKEEGK